MSGKHYGKLMTGSWDKLDNVPSSTQGERADKENGPQPDVSPIFRPRRKCSLWRKEVLQKARQNESMGQLAEEHGIFRVTTRSRRSILSEPRKRVSFGGPISIEDAFQHNDHSATSHSSSTGEKKRRSSRRRSAGAPLADEETAENGGRRKRRRLSVQEGDVEPTSTSGNVLEQDRKRSVHPSYEPPSVKRRKLLRSGRLKLQQREDSEQKVDPLNGRRRTRKVPSRRKVEKIFPTESMKEEIESLIDELDAGGVDTDKSNLSIHHLRLCLNVLECIAQRSPGEVVESIITSMSIELDVSHLRLTRFLQGDRTHSLSKREVSKIAGKLESWIAKHQQKRSIEGI